MIDDMEKAHRADGGEYVYIALTAILHLDMDEWADEKREEVKIFP